MNSCCFRCPVKNLDFNKNVFLIEFGVFDEAIEIIIFIENTGFKQLIFGLRFVALLCFFDQLLIRKSRLRIFI